MIRLRDLLREFEYGEKLWADPYILASEWDRHDYRQFYDGMSEPNTSEETAVLKAIQTYIEENTIDDITPKMLKDLKRLKARFPRILDPKETRRGAIDYVYRGMSADPEWLMNLIEKLPTTAIVESDKWLIMHNVDVEVVSQNTSGFVSVSPNHETAAKFSQFNDVTTWRWPILTKTPYARIANQALWNPDYLDRIGGLGEREIWLLGNRFPVEDLWMAHPRAAREGEWGPLTASLWRQKQQALTIQRLEALLDGIL
jgi:hypothetical protein